MSELSAAAERIAMLQLQLRRYAMAIEAGEAMLAARNAALKFIQDLAEEELPHAKVGTGAEVALRHIARRARETLAK